jgi:hypothetical protein
MLPCPRQPATVMASVPNDVEKYATNALSNECDALLPLQDQSPSSSTQLPRRTYNIRHLLASFAAGIVACAIGQIVFCSINRSPPLDHRGALNAFGQPHAGSTEVHKWPPAKPTNNDPVLFPSNVGHAGATPTGAEPALIATAPLYPMQTSAPNLLAPPTLRGGQRPSKDFDLLKKWGNLSPWYSVGQGVFGVDSSPEVPETCRVTGLHFLHRHGARYPTSWGELTPLFNQACLTRSCSGVRGAGCPGWKAAWYDCELVSNGRIAVLE